MYAPLPQAPRARVEKAYFRAKYDAGHAGLAIGTSSWELVNLNETAHDASPAPSFAAIAASPYSADGSVIISTPGIYDFDYRIGVYVLESGTAWARTRIRQIPGPDFASGLITMPYSQGITTAGNNYDGDSARIVAIGAACRQEITELTKVWIDAWVSAANWKIGTDTGASASGEPAVYAWLTVTKV